MRFIMFIHAHLHIYVQINIFILYLHGYIYIYTCPNLYDSYLLALLLGTIEAFLQEYIQSVDHLQECVAFLQEYGVVIGNYMSYFQECRAHFEG